MIPYQWAAVTDWQQIVAREVNPAISPTTYALASLVMAGNAGKVPTVNGTGDGLVWTTPGGGSLTDGDKGDITVSGSGSTWAIDANVVTYAKMQDVSATSRFIGRITTGAGDPEELTGTQATTLLDPFTSALKGLAPASGGGTTNFLRADGAWAAPAGGGGTTTNALTINNSGTGAASGATFNGSAAVTISRNTIGAAASGANTDITALNQSVSVAASGAIAADSIGYRGIPFLASQGTAYTFVLGDASKCKPLTAGGWTIPANSSVAYPVGTILSGYNDSASSQTVAITTDTMYLEGSATTGSRTIAQRSAWRALKVSSTTWIISGGGVT